MKKPNLALLCHTLMAAAVICRYIHCSEDPTNQLLKEKLTSPCFSEKKSTENILLPAHRDTLINAANEGYKSGKYLLDDYITLDYLKSYLASVQVKKAHSNPSDESHFIEHKVKLKQNTEVIYSNFIEKITQVEVKKNKDLLHILIKMQKEHNFSTKLHPNSGAKKISDEVGRFLVYLKKTKKNRQAERLNKLFTTDNFKEHDKALREA